MKKGLAKTAYDHKYYQEHREQQLLGHKQYFINHKQELEAYHKEYMKRPEAKKRGIARAKKWYQLNKARVNPQRYARKEELKKRVLTIYGHGKCACVMCGENRLPCLSIDHINNGGNEHRESINNRGGMKFYQWLKNNDYPLGYQTLCMNCQFIKEWSKWHPNGSGWADVNIQPKTDYVNDTF